MTAYSASEMCISLILYTKLAIAKDLYFISSSSVLIFDIYSCVVRRSKACTFQRWSE